MFEKSGPPQDSWSLDDLAKFVVSKLRRNAVEAWSSGNALNIAERKLKEAKTFERWVKDTLFISKATAWRYRQVATLLTHAQVEGLTLKQVYDRLDLIKVATEADAADDDDDTESNSEDSGTKNTDEEPSENTDSSDQPDQPALASEPDDSRDDDELPKWAKQPADRLDDQKDDIDIVAECKTFIHTLEQYRAGCEWDFSDPEYVKALRQTLEQLSAAVVEVTKLLNRKRAA
jgi:cobalamin biosynthesis protein CobT